MEATSEQFSSNDGAARNVVKATGSKGFYSIVERCFSSLQSAPPSPPPLRSALPCHACYLLSACVLVAPGRPWMTDIKK